MPVFATQAISLSIASVSLPFGLEMDLWIVAAAAGAGYLAKYWKNENENDKLSESSLQNVDCSEANFMSPLTKSLDQNRVELDRLDSNGRNCPLRRWVRRKPDRETTLHSQSNGTVSTGGNSSEMQTSLRDDSNTLSLSNLWPDLVKNDSHKEDGNTIYKNSEFFNGSGCETNDQANLSQPGGVSFRFGTGRDSFNCKRFRGYSFKPLNSLESCVLAQFSKESDETKETVVSSFPSPAVLNVGTNFIGNGSNVISNSMKDSLSSQSENGKQKSKTEDGMDSCAKETIVIPPRFEAGLVELQRKPRWRRGKVRLQKHDICKTLHSHGYFNSQSSHDGILLFSLGISLGVIFTVLSNRREVDRLKELLKRRQNLVHDLHDELEMKDSLTVKELPNEDCIFQEHNESSANIQEQIDFLPYQDPTAFFPDKGASLPTEYNDEKIHILEHEETSESMSKIEAELEAELARLELSIANSGLARRLSDFGQLDPDIVGEVIHGDLNANMLTGADDSCQDACSSSTTQEHPTNLAVSPRELSLRLHELNQSRLKERITELELALQQSQKQLCLMEAEQEISLGGFSSSEIGSFYTHESPTMMEPTNTISPPSVLNISENALNTHDEAYLEFMKMAKMAEEENSRQTNDKRPLPLDHIPHCGRIGDGSLLHLETDNREFSRVGECKYNNDDNDDDDELGNLLIKKIVEKTRLGSPIVLNVQRMLLSMDE